MTNYESRLPEDAQSSENHQGNGRSGLRASFDFVLS